MTVSFYKAEALVGYGGLTDSSTIGLFIERYLDVTIDTTSIRWTGQFAAAALVAAGYAKPSSFANAADWSSYGSPASTLAIGTVVILPPDEIGYRQVGIITGEASDGAAIVLCGDYDTIIVEVPMYFGGTNSTFITPILSSDAAEIQAVAAATMNGSGLFAQAEALVGDTAANEASEIQDFISTFNPNATINVATDPYNGQFTAAALASANFAIPPAVHDGRPWITYGISASSPALNLVVIFPMSADGYIRTGIITGQTSDGQWVVLVGDYNRAIVEMPFSLVGVTYRRPVSPTAQANAIATAANISAAAASAYTPTSSSTDPNALAAAAAAAAALAALLQQTPPRQGTQIGNTDTPETNQGHASSGPMPCGAMHADVTGSPGSYTATSAYSPVTRMPSHEPWTGHPVANSATVNSLDGSSAGGSSGTLTGSGTNSGNGGGGGTKASGVGGGGAGVDPSVGGAPTASPGSFSTNKFASNNNFSINAAVAVKRFMSDLNLTYDQAVGLVSNLSYESKGLKAGQQELGQAPGHGGLGWEQATGPRRTAFVAFAKSIGGSIYDPEVNYKFVVHEMQTSEKRALAALKTATNAADAVKIVEQKFERAGVVAMGGRLAYISKVQKAYTGQVAMAQQQAQQGATSQAAATAAQAAAANAKQQAQSVSSQQAQNPLSSTQGKSGAQGASVVGGGTLNQNQYNPNAPTGNSTDPNAGQGPVNAGGDTPSAGTGGAGGAGGSGGGSPTPSTAPASPATTPTTTPSSPTPAPVGAAPTSPPGISITPGPPPSASDIVIH